MRTRLVLGAATRGVATAILGVVLGSGLLAGCREADSSTGDDDAGDGAGAASVSSTETSGSGHASRDGSGGPSSSGLVASGEGRPVRCFGAKATIVGTPGPDRITGSDPDQIHFRANSNFS